MTANRRTQVREIHIFAGGDRSVGIQDSTATVIADGEFIFDLDCIAEEEQSSAIEEFREKIKDAFECVWDGPVKVTFDFELARLEIIET